MLQNRRKDKRVRGLIRAVFCGGLLLLIVFVLKGLGGLVVKDFSPSDPVEPALLQDTDTESTQENSTEEVKDERICVCIDAGHGGKDQGSAYKKRLEKDDNLDMALLVQEYLESQNVKVVMTRSDDTFLKLSKRCKIANDAEADYMVSIHRNKGDGNGVETWINSKPTTEGTTLGENIQKKLVEAGISRDRGARTGTMEDVNDDYAINRDTKMPSCIIELAFLNSSEDNSLFDANKEAYAKAIGDAILATYEEYHQGGEERVTT